MYLIQQTTKEPSEDILGFFFDFGKEALRQAINSIKKRSQGSFKRVVENYYPNTAIPFKIEVEGYLKRDPNNLVNHMKILASGYITVSFPSNTGYYIDTKNMMDAIVEKQLLGGGHLPDFVQPEIYSSKSFKSLVKEMLGNKSGGQTLLDSGHTRQDGSSQEALGRPNNQS